jgi:hypothetical protein
VIDPSLRSIALRLVDLTLAARLDWRDELQTLTGFCAADYESLQQALQAADFDWQAEQLLMMMQAINNLSGYPHGQQNWLGTEYQLAGDKLTALYDDFFAAHQMMIGDVVERH